MGFGPGELNRLRRSPHALSHLHADVKDVLRESAGEVGNERVGPPFVEDHQIDVGKRGLLPPAISAVGHKRDPFAKRGGVAFGELGQGGIVETRDGRVDERREPAADLYAVEAAIVLSTQLLTSFGQMLSGREHART